MFLDVDKFCKEQIVDTYTMIATLTMFIYIFDYMYAINCIGHIYVQWINVRILVHIKWLYICILIGSLVVVSTFFMFTLNLGEMVQFDEHICSTYVETIT